MPSCEWVEHLNTEEHLFGIQMFRFSGPVFGIQISTVVEFGLQQLVLKSKSGMPEIQLARLFPSGQRLVLEHTKLGRYRINTGEMF